MIKINEKIVSQIPIIEVVKTDLVNLSIPLCVFYHGWQSCKERALTHAYEIAKRGYRVVVADSIYHGQRAPIEGPQPNQFFETLLENINEFPDIVSEYEEKGLYNGFLAVGGYSMGGMTSAMLLTAYSYIDAAVILMGSLDMLSYREWLIKTLFPNYERQFNEVEKRNDEKIMLEIEKYNLANQPECIDGRPIYVWHGEMDDIVPVEFSRMLLDKIEDEPYAKSVYRKYDAKARHNVPFSESVRISEFLLAASKKNHEYLWQETQKNMKQRFGYN